MKKAYLLSFLLVLFFQKTNLFAQEVSIKKTISFVKGFSDADTRIIALLSNNTIVWTTGEKNWEKVSLTGLPNLEINDLEVFVKSNMMSVDTRLLVLLNDNTIWWHADEKPWEKVKSDGLPNLTIKDISVYTKIGGTILNSTRIIATLQDNSIYWYANGKWQKMTTKGLQLK